MENDRRGNPVRPTGTWWCGCGEKTSRRAFFYIAHDRKAEAAVRGMEYGTIAEFLQHHGYAPGGPKAGKLREYLWGTAT